MNTEATAIAEQPNATVTLSAEQIAFFNENGYLAVPQISNDTELSWLREVYDRLFSARAGRDEGNQFDLGGTDEEGKEAVLPQILNPTKYAPELKAGLFRANALAIARQLLGPEAQATGDHAIFKPAGTGAPTPWHQDEAYWNPNLDYRSISIWMPLQPATVENGCMQFVPGSQIGEVLPHHSIGHDPRVHGLEIEADAATLATAVACPLDAGGATIHLSRTMHYAGPNVSGTPRRAYIQTFGLPATPRAEPRRFPWNEMKQTARDKRSAEAKKGDRD